MSCPLLSSLLDTFDEDVVRWSALSGMYDEELGLLDRLRAQAAAASADPMHQRLRAFTVVSRMCASLVTHVGCYEFTRVGCVPELLEVLNRPMELSLIGVKRLLTTLRKLGDELSMTGAEVDITYSQADGSSMRAAAMLRLDNEVGLCRAAADHLRAHLVLNHKQLDLVGTLYGLFMSKRGTSMIDRLQQVQTDARGAQ
jgi:hypothetical protein